MGCLSKFRNKKIEIGLKEKAFHLGIIAYAKSWRWKLPSFA